MKNRRLMVIRYNTSDALANRLKLALICVAFRLSLFENTNLSTVTRHGTFLLIGGN